MRVLRWAWHEIDRIALVLAVPVFGIMAMVHPFIGLLGMLGLVGLWHISGLIRAKEREAKARGEETFIVVIEFHHLLLLVGLIAMALLVRGC